MKPWVLIDISYLAHRARYAIADMEWEDFHTGVLFGFWEQLRTICTNERIRSNHVLLFFDSRQSYRKKLFPQYKAKRHSNATPEEIAQLREMYVQLRLLYNEILPAVGFRIYRQTGLESDDLMAQAALQIEEKGEQGIIVTADGDLWQCITDNIHWFDPARRKYYTPETFMEAKGIAAGKWGQVKANSGCSGDGVPGIKGVGEKTAIKFLTYTLPIHYQTFKAIQSNEGELIYKRNVKLVILPHEKTKPIDIRPPEYDTDAFFRYCKRYGFLTYLKSPKRREWEDFFGLLHSRLRKRKQR